jgi:hypothetical protein
VLGRRQPWIGICELALEGKLELEVAWKDSRSGHLAVHSPVSGFRSHLGECYPSLGRYVGDNKTWIVSAVHGLSSLLLRKFTVAHNSWERRSSVVADAVLWLSEKISKNELHWVQRQEQSRLKVSSDSLTDFGFVPWISDTNSWRS